MLVRVAVLAAFAGALVAAPGALAAPPAPVSLNGDTWAFRQDPNDRGLAAGWDASAPTGGWRPVSVPSTFDARPLERLFSGTVGWYRLEFQAPETPPGYAWALRFDQVRRKTVVWLNGRRIGSHDDPYTPFQLEARGLRRGLNELVLRVDSRKGSRPREGWWNWGGILRPVTLVPRGRLVLNDLGLLPRVNCSDPAGCRAVVRVTGAIRNRLSTRAGGELAVTLKAPDGTETRQVVKVPALAGTESRVLAARIPVNGPIALWDTQNPQLYDASVTLRSGGRVEQHEQMRIGMRQLTIRGGQLYLNGRPVKMYGAAIQEDFPGRGAALTPEDNAEIVAELESLGANATRAHYPLNQDLLTKFDEAGILVWNEAPIYHQNRELNRPEGRKAALDTVRGTILSTRNHASVVVHSVANEPVSTPDDYPGSRMWLKQAAKLARRLDPTRPVAVDILSYPNVPFQKTYTQFDALGINNYYGWYVGKPTHPTGNFLDLEPYLQKMRRRYPKQALVMTEFGAEATRSGPAEEKGTFEFQADYVNRTMDVVNRNDFMDGAMYWTVREFAVKPDWLGGIDPAFDPNPDAIHNKALIAYDGAIKPAFDVMKQKIAAALAPPAA